MQTVHAFLSRVFRSREPAGHAEAGIVHQHRKFRKRGQSLRHALQVRIRGQVGGDDFRFRAVTLSKFGGESLQAIGPPRDQNQVVSARRERARERRANTCGSARDGGERSSGWHTLMVAVLQ
jgi:hypothetical protein